MLDFKTGAIWKLVNTVFLLWGAWGSQGDTRAYRVQLSREDIIVGIQYAMADSMSNSASMKEHIVIVRIHRAFAFGSYLLESSFCLSLGLHFASMSQLLFGVLVSWTPCCLDVSTIFWFC